MGNRIFTLCALLTTSCTLPVVGYLWTYALRMSQISRQLRLHMVAVTAFVFGILYSSGVNVYLTIRTGEL